MDWLLCPRDFPGKSTRVGCHFLLQAVFLIQVFSKASKAIDKATMVEEAERQSKQKRTSLGCLKSLKTWLVMGARNTRDTH